MNKYYGWSLVGIWLVGMGLVVGFWAGIIYIAHHFISKFW